MQKLDEIAKDDRQIVFCAKRASKIVSKINDTGENNNLVGQNSSAFGLHAKHPERCRHKR